MIGLLCFALAVLAPPFKSELRLGRPHIATELRVLTRRMSVENSLWGAPPIRGELLKLGFEVAPSSVANTWSSDAGRPARNGAPFCVIMLNILPPWTCSLSRPLASTCSTSTSSCGWTAPLQRAIEHLGAVVSRPVLGGLHYQYCRIKFSARTSCQT
jgi:hypothetical protein